MLRYLAAAIAGLAATALAGSAAAKPPPEAFGDAPAIRSAHISPDGKTIAYINRINGVDYLAKYDVATAKNEALIKIPDIKAGGVGFAGSNYIILRAAKLTNNSGRTKRYEDTAAFAYNLTTRKIVQLLVGTTGLYPYQSGLGQIVGIDPGGQYVFMPAYMDKKGSDPTVDLLKVNLDTGRGARVAGWDGANNTRGWVMNDEGQVVARIDYSDKRRLYEIRAYDPGGGQRVIYSETTTDPSLSIVGFAEKEGTLIATLNQNSDFSQMYEMSLADGKLTGPLRTRPNAEIEGIIRDDNKVVIGVSYSGLYPSYEIFDTALNSDIKAAINALPDASVSLASWSEDWSKILLYAEGGKQPGRYMLFDRAAKKLSQIARSRPDIKPEEVGEVITIEYKARDGLTIPALITWPAGVAADQRKNLPMIVMPHGGPEAYDSVGFDWLAQFLANEGYVVLQPNFRGSGGFGASFAQAGYKQWGRKMQDDVTDGAKALMTMGWADPNRTCILGWSYGGYAALAGGALTPDLYKCVVAIAGVSDLRSMLGWEKRERGARSTAFAYWTSVIGDIDQDADAIEAVSPYRLAANFKAPVLLIHGGDDLTVPDRQSEMMEQALKAANKPVTYLRIGKDDHSLVAIDSRNKALAAISEFLNRHIGK
jgi:dipeptidyl aminopeptidase/acylaminoacyl peptidase